MVPLVTGCPDGCRPCVWYSGGHNKRSTLWVWCAQQQTVTALYRAVPMPSHVPRTSKAVTTSTHHLCRHGSDTARFTRHQISLRPRLKPPFCNCRIWQRSVTCGHMSRRGNNALVETLATCPFDTDCQQMWHKSEESQTFLFVKSNLLLRSHDSFILDTCHVQTDSIIRHIVGTGSQWPDEHLGIILEQTCLPNKSLVRTVQQLLASPNVSVVWSQLAVVHCN